MHLEWNTLHIMLFVTMPTCKNSNLPRIHFFWIYFRLKDFTQFYSSFIYIELHFLSFNNNYSLFNSLHCIINNLIITFVQYKPLPYNHLPVLKSHKTHPIPPIVIFTNIKNICTKTLVWFAIFDIDYYLKIINRASHFANTQYHQ